MSESDWWAASDPIELADWLLFDTPATDRKLRLICVAWCRWVEHLVSDHRFVDLLQLTEHYADGIVSEAELQRAHQVALSLNVWNSDGPGYNGAAFVAEQAILGAAGDTPGLFVDKANYRSREFYELGPDQTFLHHTAANTAGPLGGVSGRENVRCRQVQIIYDIFGSLPFRDIATTPNWLTSTVTALAKGIYDEKAFDRMPILADALQDAGCDNDEILSHCRREGWEHVRGCWVLDLLLGRPWKESANG